ncbi:tail-specific protease precursor [mine drainage metagenome]|uniref:Tail-specific protease n=1 Tax=mine drainage metagenome TaxID=410659 RepID=A0A1J5PKN2_9ZZZZ
MLPADSGPDGIHKLVTLVRKTITLQDQAAKSSVHTVVTGGTTHRIAVISLPSFYEDFAGRQSGAENYKSAAHDVARILDEVKKQKVDGVLIDLRNNGGGSLEQAIELSGLFIGKGPVVQQRNAKGEITVGRDKHASMAWDGPLAVLINRGSASASEIFAAAIQDYGRGLILGEPSFGKGTVQTMVNLDQIARNSKPRFGELKMTIAQFFRVNGGTTQLRGVTPDITLAGFSDTAHFGESSFGNALPWSSIKAADYAPLGDIKPWLPLVMTRHEERIKKDKDFQYLLEDIARARLLRQKNLISLNEAERRKERDAQEARQKSRDLQAKSVSNPGSSAAAGKPYPDTQTMPRDDGLQADERNLTNELALEKAQKTLKDVLLTEAVSIVGGRVVAQKTSAKLIARRQPD